MDGEIIAAVRENLHSLHASDPSSDYSLITKDNIAKTLVALLSKLTRPSEATLLELHTLLFDCHDPKDLLQYIDESINAALADEVREYSSLDPMECHVNGTPTV